MARFGARGVVAVVVIASSVQVPALAAKGPARAQLRSKQSVSIAYNQGIARVPGGWILSGTNYPKPDSDVLARTDEQFHVITLHRGAIPAEWRAQRYVHIGDIDVVGDVIYAPLEQPDYAQGHQVTARYDLLTLRFLDAVVLPQHENSFVAVDSGSKIAYSMDHFDGDALLRYDLADSWKPLTPLRLSMPLQHTQGASVAGGNIWICTSDDHNDLYRVSIRTGRVELAGQITDPLGEGEGIDATTLGSGALHAMVVDPDKTKVWIEHFDVPNTLSNSSSRTGRTVAGAAVAVVAAGVVAVVVAGGLRRRKRAQAAG